MNRILPGDMKSRTGNAPGRQGDQASAGPPRRARIRRGGARLSPFEVLREDIISVRLPPGAVLSRTELQERFGLSSTPIRDALTRLQEEHLVDIFPQHATVVSLIDEEIVSQARFLRRACEMELARMHALSRDPALVETLRSHIRQQRAFAVLGEFEAYTASDLAFHKALYDAGGMAPVWTLVRRQSGHFDRLRRLSAPIEGRIDNSLIDHTEIVDAIEAGDPGRAQDCVRRHLSRSVGLIDELRAVFPDFFVAPAADAKALAAFPSPPRSPAAGR